MATMTASAIIVAMPGQPSFADALTKAVFDICPLVLAGKGDFDDGAYVDALGYKRVIEEEGEQRIAEIGPDFRILVTRQRGKPGCRVVYKGPDTAAAHEALYAAARSRGFGPAHGKRAAPEQGFILDTMFATAGPIGMMTLFLDHRPDSYAMVMIYPALGAH